MRGTSKKRVSEYQILDTGHHAPLSSSQSRTGHLLTIMVSVLCFTSIISIMALTYRSLRSAEVIIVPESEMKPVLVMTEGGGWSRSGQPGLGKLPPPNTPDPKWDPEPSDSDLGLFDYAAVSVDSIPCAKIGK